MKTIEIVALKAKELGYTTTKHQYILISKLMAEKGVDIEPEECRHLCNLQRYCRMVLNSDEVAQELEKKWHKSESMHNQEADWNSTFKRQNSLN